MSAKGVRYFLAESMKWILGRFAVPAYSRLVRDVLYVWGAACKMIKTVLCMVVLALCVYACLCCRRSKKRGRDCMTDFQRIQRGMLLIKAWVRNGLPRFLASGDRSFYPLLPV